MINKKKGKGRAEKEDGNAGKEGKEHKSSTSRIKGSLLINTDPQGFKGMLGKKDHEQL